MELEEDLKMILMTLFGYLFFTIVTIFIFLVVKYLKKRRNVDANPELNESMDNRSQFSSALIDKSESEFGRSAATTQRPKANWWENWGELVLNENDEEISPQDQEKKNIKNSLKRYNPYEWLNIDFIFDESGLQEAYKDIKKEFLKRANQDREFTKYDGFFDWIKSMIIIDEKIIK